MKKRGPGQQVNQYDKILKENLEAILPGLIRNILGIQAIHNEELPDDIQHTKERKPDVLKKITNQQGETFVLHVEFQVKNEPEMAYRMAEYFIMLLRRYQLPIRQYVIYIGPEKLTMHAHIKCLQMTYQYNLLSLAEIDYKQFLSAEASEEKMLAILGDFNRENPKQVVERIVIQVVKTTNSNFEKLRYIQQLRILSQLRNLHPESLHIMDSIAQYISEENDILYRRGELKGLEKGATKKATEVVTSLLLNTDFSIARIADLAGVTEYFVKKVKRTLH